MKNRGQGKGAEAFQIELGKTDGFRYVGIKPPVSQERAAQLYNKIEHYLGGEALVTSCEVVRCGAAEPHTSIGVMTGSDELIRNVAGVVVGELHAKGASVRADLDHVAQIGWDTELFESRS